LGVAPPDLAERVTAGLGKRLAATAGVVAADVEGQEIESGVDPPDPRFLLIERKTSLLQPCAEPVTDCLGLFTGVAQDHKIVRISYDSWTSGFDIATVFVANTCGCFHSL
jgi:hypothetical protein